MAKRSGSSIRVQQDLLRSLREAAESWWPRLTSELRWAAHYVHEDSCTRLYSGPGYPVQAAAWIMMARKVAASPDSLVVHTPTPLEVEDGAPTSEMVVEIAGAMFAAPLTDRVVRTMTGNAVKTLETVLAPGYDPWAGWRKVVLDASGRPMLGPALRSLQIAIGAITDSLRRFEDQRVFVDHELQPGTSTGEDWYAVVEDLQRTRGLISLVDASLGQAGELPEGSLPLDQRFGPRLGLQLRMLESMLSMFDVPSRHQVPGVVGGHLFRKFELPFAALEDLRTQLAGFAAVLMVAKDSPAALGGGDDPGPLTPRPEDEFYPSVWFVDAVNIRFNQVLLRSGSLLKRWKKEGRASADGELRQGRMWYRFGFVAGAVETAPMRNALKQALAGGFAVKPKPRGRSGGVKPGVETGRAPTTPD